MTNQVQQSIKFCMHCLQHEGNLPKAPIHPIASSIPMDLLHVDFTSIKTIETLSRIDHLSSQMSWCSRTISQNTLWHT